MHLRHGNAQLLAVIDIGAAHPHTLKEGDHGRWPAGEMTKALAIAVTQRCRAVQTIL